MPVRCPDQFAAVQAEHGKTIERRSRRYLLQAGAIGVDQEQVEVSELWVSVVVRREDDFLAIGGPGRTAAPSAQGGKLVVDAATLLYGSEGPLVWGRPS